MDPPSNRCPSFAEGSMSTTVLLAHRGRSEPSRLALQASALPSINTGDCTFRAVLSVRHYPRTAIDTCVLQHSRCSQTTWTIDWRLHGTQWQTQPSRVLLIHGVGTHHRYDGVQDMRAVAAGSSSRHGCFITRRDQIQCCLTVGTS